MNLKHILLAAFLLTEAAAATGQIVTSDPAILQENSKDVYIIYHADQGNKGLMGLTKSDKVYAHTGVITSTSNGQWTHAPSKWGDNSPKYELTWVSDNTWRLDIGDMRTYYGVTADETIEQLAFVFRNADCSREGKTATGGDIFLDVLPPGLSVTLICDAPKVLDSTSATVSFSVNATEESDVTITFDDDTEPITFKGESYSFTHTFSQGDWTVNVTAKSGDLEASASRSFCYPAPSPEAEYPGGTPIMGAVAQPDGSVTFCLAAPMKETALLVGSWEDYQPRSANVMNHTDINGLRYFWLNVKGLDSATDYPYYYIVDNTRSVGDPYARLVLDPYNDKWLSDGQYPDLIPYPYDKIDGNVMLAVYNGARDDYDWEVTDYKLPAQEDLIIYELLVRDFTGTEGKAKGDGTLRKAMGKLNYLTSLGVNAVELMPIMEFNGNNSWGYNTNFYMAPDKAYGTPDDYRAFIDACHKHGLAVILDIVFNQSDGLHPWYQLYDAGSNPFYNERAPHAYSVLNDWNQDNLLVQQQWADALTYWMEAYHVDGFRFDLVKGLGDNESYGDNASESNTNKYNSSRVARMKSLTEVIKSVNPDAYSINENLAGSQEENEMAANGSLNWANINNAACQFAMGYSSESNCNRFYAPLDSRTWGSTVSYAESHDEQRMAYKQDQWGVAGVKGDLKASLVRLGSVAAQMILAPGAHMIWQFGELGNATNTKNSDGSNNTDPKPVYWNYVNNPDRQGLLKSYKELNALRKDNPELFAQDAKFEMACSASNWAAGRTLYASTATQELICVINPDVKTVTVKDVKFGKSDKAAYTVLSSSHGCDYNFDPAAKTVTLEPGAYIVLGNGPIAGIESISVDSETATTDAVPVYYNLQGMRVDNPAAGQVYICRRGDKATKVIL